MTTNTSAPIAFPYTLTVDEESYARASYSWSMRPDAVRMLDQMKKLSPQARAELLLTTEVFVITLRELVKQDKVSALLEPDALPDGVEGLRIGGRA